MRHVTVVIHEDVILSSACAPLDILNRTNDILRGAGEAPGFQVELASEKLKNVLLTSPAQFLCHRTVTEVGHTDLILVPAFGGEPEAMLAKHGALVEWIRAQYARGTEVASLCVGSYFLAEAGLLDGKTCTSHWAAAADLQARYPRIKVQADSVITDQNGVYTGGGAFSSLNLLLYLIEKFHGHDIGVQVAKTFSIHPDHKSQAHFSVFHGQRLHKDEAILRAQLFIEANYSRDLNVDDMAGQASMSKRNFIRRFKTATQNTPLEYLQRVRIEAAKKLLEASKHNVATLMYEVGYNDAKTFRDIFRRITGVTPQTYKTKYARG